MRMGERRTHLNAYPSSLSLCLNQDLFNSTSPFLPLPRSSDFTIFLLSWFSLPILDLFHALVLSLWNTTVIFLHFSLKPLQLLTIPLPK